MGILWVPSCRRNCCCIVPPVKMDSHGAINRALIERFQRRFKLPSQQQRIKASHTHPLDTGLGSQILECINRILQIAVLRSETSRNQQHALMLSSHGVITLRLNIGMRRWRLTEQQGDLWPVATFNGKGGLKRMCVDLFRRFSCLRIVALRTMSP